MKKMDTMIMVVEEGRHRLMRSAAEAAEMAATESDLPKHPTVISQRCLSVPSTTQKENMIDLLIAAEATLLSAFLAAVPPRLKSSLLIPLNVFHSRGKLMSLLQWSIDLEVVSTPTPQTLFRGDSYASRLLSSMAKTAAKDFLNGLSPLLSERHAQVVIVWRNSGAGDVNH